MDETLGAAETSRRRGPLRALRIFGTAILWLLVIGGAILIGSAAWIRQTFGPISVDQMLMHLPGRGEVTGAEEGYISSLVWTGIVLPLVVILCALLLRRIMRYRWKRNTATRLGEQKLLWMRPGGKLSRALSAGIAVGVGIAGVGSFAQAIGTPQYVQSALTSYNLDDYYVAPDLQSESLKIGGASREPMNLVTIFLESGEQTFSDDELFETNMMKPLEDATRGWDRFEDYEHYAGGGWTMAGIVGTQCGVPLKGAGINGSPADHNDLGKDGGGYLSGAVCIGDVLAGQGYRGVFMGGADTSFASKEQYLRDHGYDEVLGLSTWLELGETQMKDWGLSDERLFERAKEQVTELHEAGQPFQLTILTLDTHDPVYRYDYCPADTVAPMESVVRCSMEKVAGFVNYMEENGYLDDTVVFITGDHPKTIGELYSFVDELSPLEKRPLFNRLWVPGGVELARDQIDQLSVFATLLDVFRLGRDDHRAGVGVSALATSPGGESILDLTDDEYEELILSRSSSLYERLWRLESYD